MPNSMLDALGAKCGSLGTEGRAAGGDGQM